MPYRSSGRTRKSLWSDERVVDIIQSGVTLHRSWIQKYAGGDANVCDEYPRKTQHHCMTDSSCARVRHAENRVFFTLLTFRLTRTQTMVCVEELISLPEFSKTVEVKEWALGQYERDTLGKTLEQAIRDMTTSEQVRTKGCAAFVLTTQSHSTMVGVRRFDDYSSSAATGSLYGYKFVVFDSHTRDKATGLHIRTGKAITVRLADMTELLAYLSRLYATKTKPDELFSLHEICLKGKKKAKAGDTAVVRIPAADVEAQVIVGKADDCDLMASRLSSCGMCVWRWPM